MNKGRSASLLLATLALMLAGTPGRATPDPLQSRNGSDWGTDADESAALRRRITDDPVAPKHVPKQYDVTIVYYFDYQCPWCRTANPTINALLAADPKVRLVYRDWPIFGGISEPAARMAVAANYQGKYAAFHDALMQIRGKLTLPLIRQAAQRAGVNWTRLQSDLQAHGKEIDALIARTDRQARMMGLIGTPAYLVGPYLVPGGMDAKGFKKAIAMARANPTGDPAKDP